MIDTARGKELADEYGIKFLETSAKNSTNVDEAFITLVRDIKKRLIDWQEEITAKPIHPELKVQLPSYKVIVLGTQGIHYMMRCSYTF